MNVITRRVTRQCSLPWWRMPESWELIASKVSSPKILNWAFDYLQSSGQIVWCSMVRNGRKTSLKTWQIDERLSTFCGQFMKMFYEGIFSEWDQLSVTTKDIENIQKCSTVHNFYSLNRQHINRFISDQWPINLSRHHFSTFYDGLTWYMLIVNTVLSRLKVKADHNSY